MKSLDFSSNFSRSNLHSWGLVRPEHLPFIGRPETWMYKTLAWNDLEGLRGRAHGLTKKKILKFKLFLINNLIRIFLHHFKVIWKLKSIVIFSVIFVNLNECLGSREKIK